MLLPLVRRLVEGLLILLFAVLTFLLACYELSDSDILWHLKGGQWILQNWRVPDLDPFTFGSADQHWVDAHWLFQIVLALAYRANGFAGTILLAATVGTAAVLVALASRRPGAPLLVVLLCWLPALVLTSNRFDPRPEIFSLFYLACYLAVLGHLDERPRLAWLLPLVQMLWVNMQGLFILGPVLLGFFLLHHLVRFPGLGLQGRLAWDASQRRWWRHVGGASVAVALACLLTPYGLEGTLFPLALYPKATQAGNPYKTYIDELKSFPLYVAQATPEVAGDNWYFCSFHWLLLMLPFSFLLPAIWQACQPLPQTRPQSLLWPTVLSAGVVLLAANTLTFSTRNRPELLVACGHSVPLVFLAAGLGGAVFLARRRLLSAAALTLAGGVAQTAWIIWLNHHLTNAAIAPSAPVHPALPIAAVAGLLAGVLLLRHGGSLFRILLAGSFAYLALTSINNMSRFGLVAGVVLGWNLGEWLGRLPAVPLRWAGVAGWSGRLGLAALLLAWMGAVATERYTHWTGEIRHVRLRERPLVFAHDAVRFAAGPGLPERALVFDISQACVYTLHNAPQHKVFLDARFEMPTLQTFQTYVAIEDQLNSPKPDPRWVQAVHEMGDPLLLISHEQNANAQAAVLAHPRWRLIYFDALAAVFVSRDRTDLESAYPTIDLAARHFHQPAAPSSPDVPGATWVEARALANLGAALRNYPEQAGAWRVPVLLRALDRAHLALNENAEQVGIWTVLGNCHWGLVPDQGGPPANLADGWDPFAGLTWAQATYCHHRALERKPTDSRLVQTMYRLFAVRRMVDAQRTMGERLLALGHLPPEEAGAIQRLVRQVGPARSVRGPLPENAAGLVSNLLRAHRLEEVTRLDEAAQRQGLAWPWPVAEQVASAWMHLGQPAQARRVWERALPAAPAVQLSRVAGTYWVERDFETALRLYTQARQADPRLSEPCWALAWMHTQLGQAEPALEACRAALGLELPERVRKQMEELEKLLARQTGRSS
jgi:tetratricopeptide (TPR) repeat protein